MTFVCYRRLSHDDFASSKWSIATQKAGNWIEVRDASAVATPKWSIAQIVSMSPVEIRVNVATWKKGRDEYIARATCRSRVAKLGTHVNLYLSPSYPFTRKQGSVWHVGMRDLEQARDDFDQFFYDLESHGTATYLARHLIPFIEKSLLCLLASSELTDEMNAFHQHVLKNVVAKLLSTSDDSDAPAAATLSPVAAASADPVTPHLLALLRMILNGHNACMFFYIKYIGTYAASKYQKLVYTSYVASPDGLATLSTRHPCRSLYFVDNVDLFLQAGGFRVILQRLARRDVALSEVALFCSLLYQAKPCIATHKRRRSSSSKRRPASAVDSQVEDFFRDFLDATLARLRRLSGDELKDDDGLVDHIVGMLDLLYRDGVLLGHGTSNGASDVEADDSNADSTACDATFAEAIEVFHLDLSKTLICCPFLSQRLHGVARLNDLIAMAQRRDDAQKRSSLGMRRTSSASSTSSALLSSSDERSSSGHAPSVAKWLRAKYVVEWLAASDVLEVILGERESCAKYALHEGTHLEILKRAKKLYAFVAMHGLLHEQHVVLLWKTGMSQLASGRKTVLDMLLALCTVLSADLVDVVMVLLTQVPLSEYDEVLVHFVKRLVVIASKQVVETEAAGTKKTLSALVGVTNAPKLSASAQRDVDVLNKVVTLGCCLLWNAILDGEDSALASLRPSMRSEVETALAASLNYVQKLWTSASSASSASAKEQQTLLREYLQKCTDNIQRGVLVETSMSLIERIVDGYGTEATASTSSSVSSSLGLSLPRAASFGASARSSSAASPSELLKELNATYGLVALVANEIQRYMTATPVDARDARAMRRRLNFLGFIVTKSEVELSLALIEQLAQCFCGDSSGDATTDAADVFFEWLTGIIPDPSNFVHRALASTSSAFASGVPAELFASLTASPSSSDALRLDVRSMGKHAFYAFERLFRLVNTTERALSIANTAQRATSVTSASSRDEPAECAFVVESLNLKGLETLYAIALGASADDVSNEAINYVIALHLHVGSKLVRREVWTDFVCGCFDRLKAAQAADTNDEATATLTHRVLVLLGTFLFQSEVQSRRAAQHAATDDDNSARDGLEELIVHVRTQDGRTAVPFRYQLKRTSLVSELRARIAKDTNHPADRVRIVNEFRTKLTAQGHDKYTLEKARVFSTASATTASAKVAASSSSKRVNFVEAIMLAKVESDTVGHVLGRVAMTRSVGSNRVLGTSSDATDDWDAVKAAIARTSDHVELLFTLLSERTAICEEAWKVLKLLATDVTMETRTRSLNDALGIDGSIQTFPATAFDWRSLLDLSCAPKLLYQLELVERFAISSDALPSDETDDQDTTDGSRDRGGSAAQTLLSSVDSAIGVPNRWSESFLKLGGKTHLTTFVLANAPRDLVGHGALARMCLAKVLKLLRHFALVEYRVAIAHQDDDDEVTDDAAALSTTDDARTLLHRLLATLESLRATEDDATPAALSSDAEPLVSDRSSKRDAPSVVTYDRAALVDPDNVFALPSRAYVMTQTLSFIATCALTASCDALPLLESYDSVGSLLLECLVESAFAPVRVEAARLIAALSTAQNARKRDRMACCDYFLALLSAYSGAACTEEYCLVLTLLVQSAESLSAFDFLASSRTLCRRIKSFSVRDDVQTASPVASLSSSALAGAPSTQQPSSASSSSPDALLEALLSTLLTIVQRIPAVSAGHLDVPFRGRSLRAVVASTLHEDDGILDEVFHRCLFATPETASSDQDDASSNAVVLTASSQYYLQKPKCRSDSARDVAFALLTELVKENPLGLQYVLEHVARQHSLRAPAVPRSAALESSTSSSFAKRKSSSKSSSAAAVATRHHALERAKYVGLKNLGCTCYLNSTMQSFFMIPRFRRQILRFHALASAGSATLTTGSSSSSSTESSRGVLYELQSLFAHLEGTAKPYYNPKAFTSALKTWDGERIDVTQQQDASEFLTSFFQQLESEMNGVASSRGVDDESILTTFFGGVFSNELVADGGRYSERAEPFHFISVPVRDRKTLTESLDSWVEGETVSYTWDKASNESTDDGDGTSESSHERVTLETHKRISIAKLPDQLIIHLKRFEFDFERMQQLKLHDRFEFPMTLDMYPYTKEGQAAKRARSNSTATSFAGASASSSGDSRTTAPEYSQYELVGTVVHMGTANSGHYYSFLREQEAPDDADDTARQWFEFNDTLVTPFDPSQIPDECFGGEDERRPAPSSPSTSPRMKTRSSFMLFYARKKPTLAPSSDTPPHTRTLSFATSALVLTFVAKLQRMAQRRLESLRRVAHVIAPEPIRQLIAMENRLFWRKTYLYDARCLRFTHDLVAACVAGLTDTPSITSSRSALAAALPLDARSLALETATKFVFGTLWQGGHASNIVAWKPVLVALYRSDADGSLWLLSTLRKSEALLLDLLVHSDHADVRDVFASVLSEAIATAASAELETDVPSSSGKKPKRRLPVAFEFVFQLVQLMPALLVAPVAHHYEYFRTLYAFAQSGRNESAFLVVNSVVGAIVALATGLGQTQPLLQTQLKRVKGKQLLKSIDLSPIVLKLLSLLLRTSLPPAIDVGATYVVPTSMAHEPLDLPTGDVDVLVTERFVTLLTQRASRYSRETKPLEQVVMHLCWESRRVSTLVLETIMSGIEREDHHDVKPYFRTLSTLLKVRDSLAAERLRDSMTKLVAVMASQQRYYKATEVSLEMLTRVAKRHASVTQWLAANHTSVAWMDKWLSGHRGSDGYLQQKRTVLVKPHSTSSWANVSLASAGLGKTIDRAIARLLPRIRSLLDPNASMEAFYDSDENPSRLVGKRIRVKWAKDKWYDGVVERFDESTYEHFVVYDDGDKRSYRMSEKQFYVVEASGGGGSNSSGSSSNSSSTSAGKTPPSSSERSNQSKRT